MIEQDLVTYLTTATSGTLIGGKVYYHRVPKDVKMPWIIIGSAGGTHRPFVRTKGKMIADENYQIFVDDELQFRGRDVAAAVAHDLEEYRGNMGNSFDVYIQCDAVRDLETLQGGFRYLIPIRVRYRYTNS